MKNKCDCYHTKKERRYTYNLFTGNPIEHVVDVGVCWGTKEMERCSCCGNRAECDFYPEVRAEVNKSATIEDAINHFKYGITYDIFKEPVTTYAKMAVEALEKMKSN
jgi:hypothetical protein